jgi:hypothetical protein
MAMKSDEPKDKINREVADILLVPKSRWRGSARQRAWNRTPLHSRSGVEITGTAHCLRQLHRFRPVLRRDLKRLRRPAAHVLCPGVV